MSLEMSSRIENCMCRYRSKRTSPDPGVCGGNLPLAGCTRSDVMQTARGVKVELRTTDAWDGRETKRCHGKVFVLLQYEVTCIEGSVRIGRSRISANRLDRTRYITRVRYIVGGKTCGRDEKRRERCI